MPPVTLTQVLADLYASEISFTMAALYDGGVQFWLTYLDFIEPGETPALGVSPAAADTEAGYNRLARQVARLACEKFPQSQFAARYAATFPTPDGVGPCVASHS